MAFEEIYGRLMAAAALTDKHKQELIDKRGFSEGTISRFRFGSGGSHLMAFEQECLKMIADGAMREQDLVVSGIFIHDGKAARMNPVLLRETNRIKDKDISNIIIPYLNQAGDVYLIRPHKLGLGGLEVEIYQDANLAGDPAEIIITEGEFKAVAAMQYGFPTIAIPGISSFSEKHWPKLLALLNEKRIKRVVIMFDNETKDDPNLPGYKDKPYDRYDTQFYAYYMASKIEKDAKIDVVIATLPEAWKENGKIDIDGAASQLRTAGEMKKVVYDARSRLDYLAELDQEAKQQVLRKMNQKYHRTKIKREFNKYWVTKTAKSGSYDVPISNFVMRVVATHDTPEGVKREVEFVNEFGKRSHSFTVSSEDMASGDSFRAFALSRGDFIWRGMTDDLLTIWESEFLMMDEGRYIVESDHLGWVERERIWLFGNVAVKDSGEEIRPDQNGIFWLEKRGIKTASLNLAAAKNADFHGIPYIHVGGNFDVKEFRVRLAETIGQNEASTLLGWVTAVPFMEEIFEAFRSFPFLFVTGRWQSGKSTIAEWAANFFGLENAAKSISQTTAVAIQRSLAYYSCLPVCLDEFRNTKDVAYKNGFLRNVYNRQGAGKGVKDSDYGLRDAKVRGTLIIAGEETPKDGALLSRCIVIFVSRSKRVKNNFNWFQANRLRFSGHIYDILRRKHQLINEFMRSVAEWKDFFTGRDIDDRTALNYATVVAGHTAAFGDDVEFASWLAKETKLVQVESQEEQAVTVFLEDLGALKTRGLIDSNYWTVSDGKIYLYFHGVHQVWAQEFRKTRGEEAFKEASIRAYLKEEPGFVGMGAAFRINGHLKKCVVFDHTGASDELRNLVETVDKSGNLLPS